MALRSKGCNHLLVAALRLEMKKKIPQNKMIVELIHIKVGTKDEKAGRGAVIFYWRRAHKNHPVPAHHYGTASCHYSQGYIEASSYPEIGSLLDSTVQFAAALKDP